MADSTVVARPYAKAIFETAKEDNKLAFWADQLGFFSAIVADTQARKMLENPQLSVVHQVDFLKAVGQDKLTEPLINLLQILAKNRRLLLLPEILLQYELMRAEDEKTLNVEVTTAAEVNNELKVNIQKALSKKFAKTVRAEFSVDSNLIGGAIIRAGDNVIDGSMRNQIHQLSRQLTIAH